MIEGTRAQPTQKQLLTIHTLYTFISFLGIIISFLHVLIPLPSGLMEPRMFQIPTPTAVAIMWTTSFIVGVFLKEYKGTFLIVKEIKQSLHQLVLKKFRTSNKVQPVIY